jgi:hypothetical protein
VIINKSIKGNIMEGLTLLAVVVIVLGVAIYYGFFDSVERGANMANNRVAFLEAKQKAKLVKDYADLDKELDKQKMKEAVAAKAKLDAFEI